MGNVILSAFSDEYADDFEEQLKAMRSFGIDHIELRHINGKNVSVLTKSDVAEAKAMLSHYGIQVSAIGSPLGKIKLDGNLNAHMETARRIFETANELHTKLVRVFSFYAPDGKSITEMKHEVLAGLETMLSIADTYGITLCHENEANIYGDIPERVLELTEHFDDRLKCVFDMGNYVLENINPFPDAYDLLKPYIAYFHIKDALFEGAVVPFGKGNGQIAEILSAHRQASPSDFFATLEPHLQTFSGLNALVGRTFQNPYQYENAQTAFTDAVTCWKELI